MEISIPKKCLYYKGIVSYQGTYFYGWQSQKNKVTVQDCIEQTLYNIFHFKQRIIGSSRTDAGVHASGQVFSFYAPDMIDKEKLQSLINNFLPDTIFLHNLNIAEKNFHPRYHAKKKVYQYLISNKKLPPHMNFFIFHYQKKFDITIFRECCKIFIGTHDFKSFCSIEKIKNTVRTIYDIDIEIINDIYIISIVGNGFLRYMIRRLLGAALYIATKNIQVAYIENILLLKNPNTQLIKLPAKGLLLKNIIYNEKEIINFKNPFLTDFKLYVE